MVCNFMTATWDGFFSYRLYDVTEILVSLIHLDDMSVMGMLVRRMWRFQKFYRFTGMLGIGKASLGGVTI